jgi:hypothetical protein
MQDLFAIALKSEVTGFNHARMYWPDCDLMNFLALDLVKNMGRTVFPPIIRGADWSQPWVIFRYDSYLLEELALEIVYSWKIGGE